MSESSKRPSEEAEAPPTKARRAAANKARRAAAKRDPARALNHTFDALSRAVVSVLGGPDFPSDPLRDLTKSDKEMLRRAADDLRTFGIPLMTVLKNTPGALDLLGPVLGAARVIGWYSGPKEIARRYIKQLQAAVARAAPGKADGKRATIAATRLSREPDLVAAIRQALQSGDKRSAFFVAPTVNELLTKAGHEPVSESTIKRRLGAIRRAASSEAARQPESSK